MPPTCQSLTSLLPVEHSARYGAPSSPEAPTAVPCRRGGRSRFSGRRTSPSRSRCLPELVTCLHSFLRPLVYPQSSRTEQAGYSTRSKNPATKSPWISNPARPRLIHLSSFLPSYSNIRPNPGRPWNRGFPLRPSRHGAAVSRTSPDHHLPSPPQPTTQIEPW